MDVQKVRENVYLVTLDRDGKPMTYEYIRVPPTGPDDWARFDYPDSIEWDLIDYEVKPEPGRPHGAVWIPALLDLNKLVYRAVASENLEFPIVLDER